MKRDTYSQARYRARIAAGLCPQCKAPPKPVVEGKTRCAEHLEQVRVRQKARWKRLRAAGLCGQCGHAPAIEEQCLCERCKLANSMRS